MRIPRRDFMKLFGSSLGTLLLTRYGLLLTLSGCAPTTTTCYTVVPTPRPGGNSTNTPTDPRIRLHLCWLRFGELAETTRGLNESGDDSWAENALGKEMIAEHRLALDQASEEEEITREIADLIQEAYEAAVNHVWRSNIPLTCYTPVPVNYAPVSAGDLVRQSEALSQVAAGTQIPLETFGKIRTALEHDLAFYALTEADVQALYDQLMEEYREEGEPIPSFEDVELTLTPEIRTAALFLLNVLMGR